jgi:hypothetical protein
MQDRVPNQTGFFGVHWGQALDHWDLLVEGVKKTVDFLDGQKVFDSARLPTVAVLPVLVALWAQTTNNPDGLGNVRFLLRRYVWHSFFSNRYEFAAATAALQDYRAMLHAVKSGSKDAHPPILDQPLPSASELLVAGWPKKRDRLSRAILLLSFQAGANDLADDSQITPTNILKREYHHLFPVAFLLKHSPKANPNLALNCALITWKTNRTISDTKPVQYLRDRAELAVLGSQALQERLNSHGIPFEPLNEGDYDGFLLRRADLFERGLRQLSSGNSWLPSP